MLYLDEQRLREISQPESFRRGKDYVSSVEQVQVIQQPDGSLQITANVYGTYRYEVSILIAKDRSSIKQYDCSCPYDFGGACKHVVALGLFVLQHRADLQERSQANDILNVLRDFAEKNGVALTDAKLQDLAKRLNKLPIQRGFSPNIQPPQGVEHPFDRIELAFSYDPKGDKIHAQTYVVYGPLVYMLDGHQLLEGDDQGSDHALRDWATEEQALHALLSVGFFKEPRSGDLVLPAEYAFDFIDRTLPELIDQYVVLADEAFRALSQVAESEITSEVSLQEGQQDWLSFSVDWKCGDRELTPEEISDLAMGWKKYLRRKDGSFVRITNQAEINRLQDVLKDSGTSKTRMTRARALELALLCQEDTSIRLVQTTKSLEAFFGDAKEGKLLEPLSLPKALQSVLRPYQRDAVAWTQFLRRYKFGGILADDMGLGKTLQALASITTERPKGALPSLVVCPKTLIPIWIAQAKQFTPKLKVHAVEGTMKERKSILETSWKTTDIFVTSYSLFQRDAEWYQKRQFSYAILDEAQFIKNPKSATALAVKMIRAEHRLALTGTPLENGAHELWSIFDFLMPGLLGSYPDFRSRFELPIRNQGSQEALQALKRRVKPFLLRRTKEMVAPELPPRIEQTDICPLTEPQAALYADVLLQVREDVYESVKTKGFRRSQIVILSALTKLRQVCNHPALVDKRSSRGQDVSGKMAYALELIREAIDGSHKVLLFSQFTSMLDIIREELDEMNIPHLTIEGKTRDRAKVVEQFRSAKDGIVFLLSLRAAGTGLTLTEADTVILYDPWWNPMVERQAMDRAHRIGQTKTVNVHKLATKGTIEERVLALQEKKKFIFDAVVSETADGMKGLNWEDVQGLFDL